MKFYIVDLASIGVKRKVVSIDGYGWELIHGQRMKENNVVLSYPQFFKEEGEEIAPTPEKEYDAPAVEEKIVNADKAEKEATPVVEEETEEVVETPVVEEETEEVVEEKVEVEVEVDVVEEKPEIDVDAVLAEAKKIKTKANLEKFGLDYGIDLNKQKSLKNMMKDFESFIKGA